MISEISKEAKDSQIWLLHNNEPKDDVLYHWKISLPIREIATLSPSEFLEQWPILKTQVAVDLVR